MQQLHGKLTSRYDQNLHSQPKLDHAQSRSKFSSGELGFLAKVMGVVAVGAGADIYCKKDNNDALTYQELIPTTFHPANARER